MNKITIGLLFISLFISCKNPAYLHHKFQFEKIAGNCSDISQKFEMNSNINGERYEFNKCLSADFTKDKMHIARQGDTVVVSFDQPLMYEQKAAYHIILDVDTYPRYNFLTIDGDTFIIVPTGG